MLTKNLLATAFLAKCVEHKACIKAINWINAEIEKTPSLNIEKLVENYVADKKISQSWANWVLFKLCEDIEEDIRKIFIRKITDSMIAFDLFLKCGYLTKEEQGSLEAKFKDKLPTAENELKKGIVIKCL